MPGEDDLCLRRMPHLDLGRRRRSLPVAFAALPTVGRAHRGEPDEDGEGRGDQRCAMSGGRHAFRTSARCRRSPDPLSGEVPGRSARCHKCEVQGFFSLQSYTGRCRAASRRERRAPPERVPGQTPGRHHGPDEPPTRGPAGSSYGESASGTSATPGGSPNGGGCRPRSAPRAALALSCLPSRPRTARSP